MLYTPETHKPQKMRSQKKCEARKKNIQLCPKVGKQFPTVYKTRSPLYHLAHTCTNDEKRENC